MGKDFSGKNIDELYKFLDEAGMSDGTVEKAKAILTSKTIRFLAGSIDATREAVGDKIEKLDKSINRLSSSSDKMFWATIVYSFVMMLLTFAIAFSALVQSGIIRLEV